MTRQRRLFAVTLLSVVSTGTLPSVSQPHLESRHILEGTLRPGETPTFTIDLAGGEFVRIDVVRRDVDITLYLHTPDGVRIGGTDLARVSWIARRGGQYQLEIVAPGARRQTLRYAFVMSERRPSTADDEQRMRAQAKLLDGLRVRGGSADERRRALATYDEALALSRLVTDPKGQCDALLLRSSVLFEIGEIDAAFAAADQARQIAHEAGERWLEAEALAHITRVHFNQRRLDADIDTAQQAISLYEAVDDRKGEHVVLQNLALAYGVFGEHRTTVELLERVLAFARATGEREGEAFTLAGLGRAMLDLGNLPKALQLQEQALATARAAGLQAIEGIFLGNVGIVQEALGRHTDALTTFHALLDFARHVGSSSREAEARYRIGAVHGQLGHDREAREWIASSLPGFRAAGDTTGEAGALADLTRIDRHEGNLTAAREHIEEALDLYETARSRIPSEEFRASFLAARFRNYELAIDVLMEMHRRNPTAGFDTAAFVTSERARARSLLDLLGGETRDLQADAGAERLERQQKAETALKAAAERQLALLARPHTREEAMQAEAAVDRHARTAREARAATRASSPRLSAMTPPGLTLEDVQRDLLDSDSALLEYFLGETRSLVWIVTRSSVRVIDLPKRAAIEAVARRAYGQLSTRSGVDDGSRASLARLVLAPVERELPARVLIVADGILQYIPFEALPISTGQPFVNSHTVAYLPSASTLAAIRRAHHSHERVSRPAAVLADPVYSPDDPRVSSHGGRSSARPASVVLAERSATEAGIQFDRLYSSRREATTIRELAGGTVLEALDFEASRETAMGPAVANARIVHFATHGLLNARHPELSGLVLSLVDAQGRPQNGFLAVGDIFDLRLHADLVVLSACETALGADVRGEGFVGLTRAFFFAGTEAVIASLWRVSDAATAALMKEFYRRLLVYKMSPAAALRASQLTLRRMPKWRQPYFWAGFVLQGEIDARRVHN